MRNVNDAVLAAAELYLDTVSAPGQTSTVNATEVALAGGATFTGIAELNNSSDVLLSVKSDVAGTVYMDFSVNGTNWDSTATFPVTAGLNEFHTLVKGPRWCRARYINGAAAQSYLRLGVYYGQFRAPNLPLSATVQQDADALTVRAITEEIGIAQGLFSGYSVVNTFGDNPDIDTSTTPEDIWDSGGVYTGFPAAGEPLRARSASASDAVGGVGAEVLQVRAMTEDWEWVTVTFNLNGTTPVAPQAPYAATNFIRAQIGTVIQSANGANTAANAGVLTVNQSVTTTNVFLVVLAGSNQSHVAAYTVPAGYTAYLRSMHASLRGATAAVADGSIWTRAFGLPFRSLRPFTATSSYPLVDDIYGGLVFTEKSDIVLRITTVSANNTAVDGGFDMILVKNA